MRTMLLCAGTALAIAGVVSLSYALLNMFGYYHVLDGPAGLYGRLHRRMIIFLVVGLVLAAAGAACLIIRSRM
jgi:hypothetical protein